MDSEDISNTATAPELPLAGPGGTLRRAREALRMDLARVAAETRIPVRHLEAIEADDFESLPSRAYAIGFSRTFAKAVGLDPAEITDAVRAELADGSMRRVAPASSMEPGDPARLPSAGLTWAAAAAVLVLAIGAFAFYRSYFGAGTEPGSLLTPEPAATTAPVAAAPAETAAPAASGPVVLTALADGVWLRLYEEGGARLIERTLAKGETVTVPAEATDPRINTGRPDALALTVGGTPVAPLGERPITISGVPVSAAALLARAATTAPAAAATPAGTALAAPAPSPVPAPRRVPLNARDAAPRETVPVPPAAEPAPPAEAEASPTP